MVSDQLKTLLWFLLILLPFLLKKKKAQSFFILPAGPNVIICVTDKHTNVHDFE